MTKLSRQKVTQIVNARARGVPVKELATQYGISDRYVYLLAKGSVRQQPGHYTLPVKRGVPSEKNHTVKLTTAEVIVIRNLKGKATAREVATAAGVTKDTVNKIWGGRTWKGVK